MSRFVAQASLELEILWRASAPDARRSIHGAVDEQNLSLNFDSAVSWELTSP